MPVLGAVRRQGSRRGSSLISYAPGIVVPGESFTRAGTTATYFDVNGVLQTTAANQKRDAHFINGVQTTLLEPAATNIVVSPRDLTNAAWVHTTMTAAKDQAGIDGVAASASSLLATGANATSLQTIVLASSQRSQQCWVKRLIGAGVIQMTMDNAIFTAIAVTGAWTRVTIPTQAAVVNPVVGFKIVTSGDKIAVDFVDNETGMLSTSPKIGVRSTDIYWVPLLVPPASLTIYAKIVNLGTYSNTAVTRSSQQISSPTPRIYIYGDGSANLWAAFHNGVALQQVFSNIAPVVNDIVETLVQLTESGILRVSVALNGGAEAPQQSTAGQVLPSAWGEQRYYINGGTGQGTGVAGFISSKIVPGIRTLAQMRAA